MSTTFSIPEEQSKKEFKVIPEGVHLARAISWIDLGTHPFTWQGEEKTPRKVRLTFETPNETAVFNEDKGEQPFLVSTDLTMSFHEKSNLFGLLSGWLGMTEGNKHEFNPEKDFLGKECMVNIKHSETKSGNTFAKIMSVTPVAKGTTVPKQVNDSTYFFMGYAGVPSEFDDEVFAGMPKFIQEKIMASPEYGKSQSKPKGALEQKAEKEKLNSDGTPIMEESEILDILG